MNRILIFILAVFLIGCKCNYNVNRAVKLQERANVHIQKLVSNGCSFDIDSVLKVRTISLLRDTVIEYKDRLIEVPSDKLVWEQTVRCDSLGRVILDYERRLKRKPKFIQGEVRIVDNVIEVECYTDSLVSVITIQDTTIKYLNTKIENLNKKQVVVEKDSSWWDGIKGILIWIFLILVLYIIYKEYNKRYERTIRKI